MPSALTATRVQRDIEVLARAGLDLETFLDEATTSIGRAIPYSAACKGSFDPSTLLLTSTFKSGRLQGWDEHDHQWGLVEFGTQEPSSFGALAAAELPAMAVRLQSPDSRRVNEFIGPLYGFGDELRVTLRDRGVSWGCLAFHRDVGQPRFELEDVELLAALSPVLARGVRSGILTVAANSAMTTAGPAVIIVDSGDQIVMVNDAAEQRMAELMTAPDGASPAGIIAGLIGAARRYSAGEITRPPRCRVRGGTGAWLCLYATTMQGRDGHRGQVAITIDEASPPEIVPLVVSAFNLTDRERSVVQLVLQGLDTKEIAATMHLSTYTVQDHLKSVFDKANVRSRRELIARIYFDQYVPRLNSQLGPEGWFSSP
jgi:DNA-binding CsgD family transcriptional regulator